MRTILALALLAPLLQSASARAQTQEDSQAWLTAEGRAELTDRVRLAVQQELRVGAEAGFDETFTDVELGHRLSRALAVAGHYRLILLDGETRHRVSGDLVARMRRKPIELSYRLRLQATSRENDSTLVPIRNKFKLAIAATRDLEPYVAVELHYQLSPTSEYRETRFYLGVQWQVTGTMDLEAFYLEQRETNVQQPETNHVLGLGAVYRFREVGGKGKGKGKDAGEAADMGPN